MKSIEDHKKVLVTVLQDVTGTPAREQHVIDQQRAQLRNAFLPVVRALIQGRVDLDQDLPTKGVLERAAFSYSSNSFTSSLSLLALILGELSIEEDWTALSGAYIVDQSAISRCQDLVLAYHDSGCTEDFYSYCANGIVKFAAGELEESVKMFRLASDSFLYEKLNIRTHLIPDFRGAFNVISPTEIGQTNLSAPPELAWNVVKTPSAKGSYVHYSAVDSTYLRRFAPQLLDSLHKVGTEAIVHIHLGLRHESELDACISALQHYMSDPRVALTTSLVPETADNAYFTMLRYFYLQQVVDMHCSPIVITDIDIAYTANPDVLYLGCINAGHHTSFYGKRKVTQCIPWFALTASFLLIANNAAGTYFSRALTALARSNFETQRVEKYNIDQNLIYALLQFMRLRTNGFVASNLSMLGGVPYKGVNKNDFVLETD